MRLLIRLALDGLDGLDGGQFIEAASSTEAAAKLQWIDPDVILTEVTDDFAFVEHIRRHAATRHIPVVIIAAGSSHRDRTRAQHLDVAAYVTKPSRKATIADTVRRALGKRRRVRAHT